MPISYRAHVPTFLFIWTSYSFIFVNQTSETTSNSNYLQFLSSRNQNKKKMDTCNAHLEWADKHTHTSVDLFWSAVCFTSLFSFHRPNRLLKWRQNKPGNMTCIVFEYRRKLMCISWYLYFVVATAVCYRKFYWQVKFTIWPLHWEFKIAFQHL